MSNQFEYYIIHNNPDQSVATIKDLSDDFLWEEELMEGIPIADSFKKTTELSFDGNWGNTICDFIKNMERLLIVSRKAMKILVDEGVSKEISEFLPFVLKDIKGRALKEQYFITNLLIKINCMNLDKSEYDVYSTSGKIIGISILDINKSKIPKDINLFRLGELPRHIIVRSDLAKRLYEETTGLFLAKMGDDVY